MTLSIRLKILALSVALLAILCSAMLVALRLQEAVHEEIAAITEYHVPLGALIAEIDVQTFEYELNLHRLLALDAPTPSALASAEKTERQLIESITKYFEQVEDLIGRGVADVRNDIADRLTLSRMRGMVSLLRREVVPFEELGLEVLEAQRRGAQAEARALMLRFERHAGVFGPDLAMIRHEIEQLTVASTTETLEHQSRAEHFGLFVFVGAAALGLGFASLIAGRLVGGLRRLVLGAQAVESGMLSEPLPVTTTDEIGQLTRAFNHMVVELRTKEKIRETFGKYVDPKIVANLIANSGDTIDAAERRVVTVFFSDIKGFSSISEQLTAGVIATFLNRWFTLATDAIRARNGVVDKYIGDAVMAFWASPFSPGDAHAADACLATLDQQDAVDTLRADLPNLLGLRRNVPDLMVRMGLATGEVVIGTIGSPTARSFTVIGDIVNLASRLEGINKVYGTRIIVAEDTWRLAQSVIEGRELDLITVAGKTETVRIFEILGRAGALGPEQEQAREHFATALACYRAQDWGGAESAFRACLALVPGDGPSLLFIDRIAKLRANPPPPDWDGVWRLSEK